MGEVNYTFETFLNTLIQIPEVSGGVVLDEKKGIICHNLNQLNDAEKYAQFITDSIVFMQELSKESRVGRFKSIHLKGNFGNIYIINFLAKNIYAAVIGNESMNIGFIRAIYEETLYEMEKVVA
jgi:predicted regulator of Ras-like GTPase activity (Roadblock/LC7/MglB family)